MPTKLSLFNGALTALGERRLSDTGENTRSARELSSVYDQVVEECLSEGSWNFAMETVKIDSDTGITPTFGYAEVFAKPSDWVRTFGLSADEYFNRPLLQYYDDADYFSADITPIYLRYVSSDTGMGLDLSRWTPKFTRFVELELADRVEKVLTQGDNAAEIEFKKNKAKKEAKNQDAMNDAQPRFFPEGAWSSSRSGRTSHRDKSGSSLYNNG